MKPIRVKVFPIAGYDTFDEAIAHAESHPQLARARADAEQLKGSVFIDAWWTLNEWIVRFDCGISLCVAIDKSTITWTVKPSTSAPIEDGYQGVGTAPVTLDWSGDVGIREMDCSSLVAKRRGAFFKDLFVSDFGLLLYLKGHLILRFSPVESLSHGSSMIFAGEID